MRKLSLTIGILITLFLFAAADFYINDLKPKPSIPEKTPTAERTIEVRAKEIEVELNSIFKLNQAVNNYKVIEQEEAKQVFGKIDVSKVNNISVVKNVLEEIDGGSPIILYEIHGNQGQGSINYLSIKVQFIAQINAMNEALNETGEYGQKSFYFNDENHKNTAFLFTQIGDSSYGFMYSKEPSTTFESVKGIISTITNNS